MKGNVLRKTAGTDWAFLASQSDEGIDFSDIPRLTPDFWKKAKVRMPERKAGITLRIDQDVLTWFRGLGRGYQTRINAGLRSYAQTTKHA